MSSPSRTPRRSTRSSSTTPTPVTTPLGRRSQRSRMPPKSPGSALDGLEPIPMSPMVAEDGGVSGAGIGIPPSSPAISRVGTGYSEVDLSSPLDYGTPSSRISLRTPRSGIHGTPARPRVDINSNQHLRQVQLGSTETSDGGPDGVPVSSSETGAGPQLVIWGTDVVVNLCKENFKKFIMRFICPVIDEDERIEGVNSEEPLYLQKLEEIHMLEEPFLNLNCAHLKQFNSDLYHQLVRYPQEVIPTFDMAVNEMFFNLYPDAHLQYQIQVRPYNADKTKNMRSLNPDDIDQLISINGLAIRMSNIIPEMREAFFQCYVCNHTVTVEIDRGRIAEPQLCTHCNTRHSFTLIHNRSHFTDKQMIKLQESQDDMPPGQTPHTIVLFAHNDLVDSVQPGDRICVTGIYRATPIQVHPRQRNVKAVYKTHIDVVHFRKGDVQQLRENSDEKERTFTLERIAELKSLSKLRDIYERLARSIAPSIYENEDVKKGILLQLFGGTKKDFTAVGRGVFRADINILLCGDPGTSKSQLLQYAYHLVPRGQYTSGKGSSAVGLTAYITKDPETRQVVLQTGALVLSDNGICCIDEFDKMSDNTRSVLHEVMEQQTLSIAKAGIICQLNARTSVLAAANPCGSQWDLKKTVTENIRLPPTLMSRFDLIYLILDPEDELFDRRLAKHLVSLYYKDVNEMEEFMSLSVLKDYIAYARLNIHPMLSEEAEQMLIQTYVKMRKGGSGHGQVSAYPRQLESLIRLSEAHAKVRFSPVVEIIDVKEAYRIYKEALKKALTDPDTGKIDLSMLSTGMSSAARKRRGEISLALRRHIETKGKVSTLNQHKLFLELREQMDIQLTREMFEDAVRDLQDSEFLVISSKNTVRISNL